MDVFIKGICFFCIGVFSLISVVAMGKNTIPSAYIRIANTYGIPPSILYSIALTESGYTHTDVYQPWPWTLNVEGKPERYQSLLQARQGLLLALDDGKHVDIGIMQINSLWHRHRVERLDHLLDPYVNLKKGAEILIEQKKRSSSSDWWEAVGRYHAPGRDDKSMRRASNYRDKVKKKHRVYTGGYL